jgi:signal transduction histidine kinase
MEIDQKHTDPKNTISNTSLRLQVAIGVAVPVLIILISFSIWHYRREYRLLDQQNKLTAAQLGETIIHSLQHAMQIKDDDHLSRILQDVNQLENIQLVQIIGLNGDLLASSEKYFQPQSFNTEDLGCVECHQISVNDRPQASELIQTSNILRVSTPIDNLPSCHQCHDQELIHLGVLLIDVSLLEFQEHVLDDIKIDLIATISSTLLVVLGVYFVMNVLVVQRIEKFRQPMAEYASGIYSARIPLRDKVKDELCELAETFNQMADQQEIHTFEREQQHELKQIAIVEERERLARELHDGLAQILGYINTEVMAIRLLLKNQKIETANQHLLDLEETSRDFFVDVREIILGLKMAGTNGNLVDTLENYTAQFSRLTKLNVDFVPSLGLDALSLHAETELHLLRIVQEALSNVRKHAGASRAKVTLNVDHSFMDLVIKDNGKGFDLDGVPLEEYSKFGLSMMRERAEAIGASFHLHSKPNLGTQVIIRMSIDEE